MTGSLFHRHLPSGRAFHSLRTGQEAGNGPFRVLPLFEELADANCETEALFQLLQRLIKRNDVESDRQCLRRRAEGLDLSLLTSDSLGSLTVANDSVAVDDF